MNKLLFIGLCLLGTALTASAQFNIYSNGNIGVNTTETPLSPLSLNGEGDSTYFAHYSGTKNGIYSHCHDSSRQWNIGGHFVSEIPTMRNAVGIKGEIVAPNLNGHEDDNDFTYMSTYGVMGIAGYGWFGQNYGVYGKAVGPRDGIGVYGTTRSDSGIYLWGDMAGLFNGITGLNGDVEHLGDYYLYGDLNVDGTINGIYLDELCEFVDFNHTRASEKKATERLSGMNAFKYYRPEKERKPYFTTDEKEAKGINPIALQRQKKPHYALPAEMLEAEFPELVYEREDGTKAVNYVEFVPLLVQAINELCAELEDVRNATEKNTRAEDANRKSKEESSTRLSSAPRLYQNTPNPFTAQTEIRFSLPDDAPSSFIYIFDMTGKMQKQIPVDPDQQSVTINGYELSAGIYLYSLVVGGQEIDTKRMILSK